MRDYLRVDNLKIQSALIVNCKVISHLSCFSFFFLNTKFNFSSLDGALSTCMAARRANTRKTSHREKEKKTLGQNGHWNQRNLLIKVWKLLL